jgi:hypothetical protein
MSGWMGGSRDGNVQDKQIGLRYLPEISYSSLADNGGLLETVISVHGFVSSYQDEIFKDLDLYRLSFRYATMQSETQIGLQKINFGPAQLLRSLRWFDRLDPTDPLNITKGVYGLRYKYSFINNANLWLWGLYGNTDPKGYEFNGTKKGSPEFGGRIQYPVIAGELALNGHTREVVEDEAVFRENRLALDGRWDVLLGLWFEAVALHSNSKKTEFPWQKLLTLGADITLPLGNGIHVLSEHMIVSASESFTSNTESLSNSAISVSYPFGAFDTFRAIGFYSWQVERFFQFYSWQRTFDTFALNFNIYSYPSMNTIGLDTPYSGYGAQIMFIYNH